MIAKPGLIDNRKQILFGVVPMWACVIVGMIHGLWFGAPHGYIFLAMVLFPFAFVAALSVAFIPVLGFRIWLRHRRRLYFLTFASAEELAESIAFVGMKYEAGSPVAGCWRDGDCVIYHTNVAEAIRCGWDPRCDDRRQLRRLKTADFDAAEASISICNSALEISGPKRQVSELIGRLTKEWGGLLMDRRTAGVFAREAT